MNKEDFEKWFPMENSATMHYIVNIAYDDGLKITLSQAKGYNDNGAKTFIVHFPYCASYFELSESYADGFWSNDKSKVWTFYKATKSPYIDYLSKNDLFTAMNTNPIHFVFVTVESVLHVISNVEPIFILGANIV